MKIRCLVVVWGCTVYTQKLFRPWRFAIQDSPLVFPRNYCVCWVGGRRQYSGVITTHTLSRPDIPLGGLEVCNTWHTAVLSWQHCHLSICSYFGWVWQILNLRRAGLSSIKPHVYQDKFRAPDIPLWEVCNTWHRDPCPHNTGWIFVAWSYGFHQEDCPCVFAKSIIALTEWSEGVFYFKTENT